MQSNQYLLRKILEPIIVCIKVTITISANCALFFTQYRLRLNLLFTFVTMPYNL